MSFIRPEAREAMWRWREVLVGAAAIVIGGWAALFGLGLIAAMGAILAVVGVALTVAGWQRGRFRQGRGGPGVVQITEGQLTYFGPFTGGTLAIAMLREVVLNPLPRAGPVWELRGPHDEPLRIPTDAKGAEALFDAFAGLPGFDTEAMLARLADPGPVPVTLWISTTARERRRLH
jgi:hypothetical protein